MTTRRNPPRSYSDHIFFASSQCRKNASTIRTMPSSAILPSFSAPNVADCPAQAIGVIMQRADVHVQLTLLELVRLYRLAPARAHGTSGRATTSARPRVLQPDWSPQTKRSSFRWEQGAM